MKGQNEEFQPTKEELESIEKAMQNEEFRKLLCEYAQEISDPENKKRYEEEIRQMEQQAGQDVKFIEPNPGFVVKTTLLDGGQKAFINICESDVIDEPEAWQDSGPDGKPGMRWSLPHSTAAHREDIDKSGKPCIVYDVVFHPRALRLTVADVRFKDMIVSTALEGIEQRFPEHGFSRNNIKFPKMKFKGMARKTVIRSPISEDGNGAAPKTKAEAVLTANSALDKLQQQFSSNLDSNEEDNKEAPKKDAGAKEPVKTKRKKKSPHEPDYKLLYRNDFDIQEYRHSPDAKLSATRPTALVITVHLPKCVSVSPIELDIEEELLKLTVPDPPGPYNLELPLPFPVDPDDGKAKFDKGKRELIVTLPVVKLASELLTSPGNIGLVQEIESPRTDADMTATATPVEKPVTSKPPPSQPEPNGEGDEKDEQVPRELFPPYTFHQTSESVVIVLAVDHVLEDSVHLAFSEAQFGPVTTNGIALTFSSSVNDCYRFEAMFDVALDTLGSSYDVSDSNVVITLLKENNVMLHRMRVGRNADSLLEIHFPTTKNVKSTLEDRSRAARECDGDSWGNTLPLLEQSLTKMAVDGKTKVAVESSTTKEQLIPSKMSVDGKTKVAVESSTTKEQLIPSKDNTKSSTEHNSSEKREDSQDTSKESEAATKESEAATKESEESKSVVSKAEGVEADKKPVVFCNEELFDLDD